MAALISPSPETWGALQEITLDYANQYVPDILIANANDMNGRGIDLHVTRDGSPIDLSNSTVNLVWRHENGNQDITKFAAYNASSGNFKVYYPNAMMHAGMVLARIAIDMESGRWITGSRNFRIMVERNPIDEDEAFADESFTAFQQAVIDLNNLEASVAAKESARVSAESSRAVAEEARAASESERVSAENARAASESERVSAESTREANENIHESVISGTYEGQDLMEILGASDFADLCSKLHSRAEAMDASGIHIGDYMDVTPTSSKINGGYAMRYLVAGIGHNYQFGDTTCPWAFWFVPDNIGVHCSPEDIYVVWNPSGSNNGISTEKHPYLCSNLHAWEIGEFYEALPTALQSVLVNHRILLEQRYSDGGSLTESNSWGSVDAGYVFSLSEMEVYGCCVWGTPGYSVGWDAQLPLFRNSRYRIKKGNKVYEWWLRTVRSGSYSHACAVGEEGTASFSPVSWAYTAPCPCFLVG